MKTLTSVIAMVLCSSVIAFGSSPDRRVHFSLGTSFGEVVTERAAIIERMNAEMPQLADAFFTPEIAAGFEVRLEPGDATHNVNGYWIHFDIMNSLDHAIGETKRTEFLYYLSHRYENIVGEVKKGGVISNPSVAPIETFIASEKKG